MLIWLSKGITTEPHLISPIPDAVLVTNLSCASDTPITSAIRHFWYDKGLNVDKLKAEYQELMKQKSDLTSTYKDCEKEVRELKRKQENLN